MGKTWKDLPKDVSHYKPFRKRKKPTKPKHEDAEAEVLKRLEEINKLPEDERDYWDAWST